LCLTYLASKEGFSATDIASACQHAATNKRAELLKIHILLSRSADLETKNGKKPEQLSSKW
jgi:hypothetical protein